MTSRYFKIVYTGLALITLCGISSYSEAMLMPNATLMPDATGFSKFSRKVSQPYVPSAVRITDVIRITDVNGKTFETTRSRANQIETLKLPPYDTDSSTIDFSGTKHAFLNKESLDFLLAAPDLTLIQKVVYLKRCSDQQVKDLYFAQNYLCVESVTHPIVKEYATRFSDAAQQNNFESEKRDSHKNLHGVILSIWDRLDRSRSGPKLDITNMKLDSLEGLRAWFEKHGCAPFINTIDCSNNNLIDLDIDRLCKVFPNLKTIKANNNTIANIKCEKLPHGMTINLANNALTTLPASIRKMQDGNGISLDVSNNFLPANLLQYKELTPLQKRVIFELLPALQKPRIFDISYNDLLAFGAGCCFNYLLSKSTDALINKIPCLYGMFKQPTIKEWSDIKESTNKNLNLNHLALSLLFLFLERIREEEAENFEFESALNRILNKGQISEFLLPYRNHKSVAEHVLAGQDFFVQEPILNPLLLWCSKKLLATAFGITLRHTLNTTQYQKSEVKCDGQKLAPSPIVFGLPQIREIQKGSHNYSIFTLEKSSQK